MTEKERLAELEETIREIGKLPLVKGIGDLENAYNKVVTLAKRTIEKIDK